MFSKFYLTLEYLIDIKHLYGKFEENIQCSIGTAIHMGTGTLTDTKTCTLAGT